MREALLELATGGEDLSSIRAVYDEVCICLAEKRGLRHVLGLQHGKRSLSLQDLPSLRLRLMRLSYGDFEELETDPVSLQCEPDWKAEQTSTSSEHVDVSRSFGMQGGTCPCLRDCHGLNACGIQNMPMNS